MQITYITKDDFFLIFKKAYNNFIIIQNAQINFQITNFVFFNFNKVFFRLNFVF